MSSTPARENLRQAITLIKNGEKDRARQLLKEILLQNPYDEKAWAWFIETLPNDRDRWIALEGLLKINPNSALAKQKMSAIRQSATARQEAPSQPAATAQSPPVTATQPTETIAIVSTSENTSPAEPTPVELEKPQTASAISAASPLPIPAQPNMLAKSKQQKPGRIGIAISALILISAGIIAFLAYQGGWISLSSNCNCAEAEQYLLKVSQRIERWRLHQSISYFAASQGDLQQDISYAQQLYNEEESESVPSCMKEVHKAFLDLLSYHLKYANALQNGNLTNAELYHLYEKDKQLQLRDILYQYSQGYDCQP
ncbi:MAG: hypothetical protein HPY45_00715 [Anaerolineae bacterium]|nr:hypothetical protein [Anaerolineae bacterium]